MSEHQVSYRQIMKATSLFGGVQVFNILIAIVRSKIVALLLGPVGVGIIGLLVSTVEVISNLTNFGLSTSAVKDVASAQSSNNRHRIATVANVIQRWVWITGLTGAILMAFLSPFLSELIFNNRNYTLAFVLLSLALLFNQLSSGQLVLLQGMQKLNYLAKANIIGNALSLLTTLPLYYFFKIDGIVPALIISSLTSLLIAFFYSKKIDIQKVKTSSIRTFAEGKGMLKLGFFLSISGLITNAASYGIRIFISNYGGVDDVGLYTSGFQIINTYVGMIFTAMGTDYFPRLSIVANDNKKATLTINQQAEIAILIMAPIILIFLVFVDWIIIILYSKKFMEVTPMVQWAAMGMLFKAVSWAIAFLFLAKGASKLFFYNELITNIYLVTLNLLGYYYGGLEGLGFSFLMAYVIYLIQVYLIARIKYEFQLSTDFLQLFAAQLVLVISCFVFIRILDFPLFYLAGVALIICSSILSYKELDKKLGFKEIFEKIKNKIIKK